MDLSWIITISHNEKYFLIAIGGFIIGTIIGHAIQSMRR